MASGSQTWRGNWADLPMVPPNSSRAATVSNQGASRPSLAAREISGMFVVPAAKVSTKIPNMNGTSPTRVVMKALMAAFEFSFSSHQCPISR